jgi:hypothetical protein
VGTGGSEDQGSSGGGLPVRFELGIYYGVLVDIITYTYIYEAVASYKQGTKWHILCNM